MPARARPKKHAKALLPVGSKRVLLIVFIPSVERDGKTPVDQDAWVKRALAVLGHAFGGATAYPKARGIWRDDERGGALVEDEPVVIHCYTTPADVHDEEKIKELRNFCRRLGRETNQGE